MTMLQMERGWRIYLRYFENKWRESLLRKRVLFPVEHAFDDRTLKLGMRDLTAWLVQRHTDFGSLDAYFGGYSIAGDRLAGLPRPADILMAADAPVGPLGVFRPLAAPRRSFARCLSSTTSEPRCRVWCWTERVRWGAGAVCSPNRSVSPCSWGGDGLPASPTAE